jgi:hypothetical protein
VDKRAPIYRIKYDENGEDRDSDAYIAWEMQQPAKKASWARERPLKGFEEERLLSNFWADFHRMEEEVGMRRPLGGPRRVPWIIDEDEEDRNDGLAIGGVIEDFSDDSEDDDL